MAEARCQASASTSNSARRLPATHSSMLLRLRGLGDLLSQEVCPAKVNASIRAGYLAGKSKAQAASHAGSRLPAASQIVSWNIQPD